jgi:hypothetical protein
VREAGGHFEAHALDRQGAVGAALRARLLGGKRGAQDLRRRTGAEDIGAREKPRERALARLAVRRAMVLELHPRLRGLVEQVETELVGHPFEHREQAPFDLCPPGLLLRVLVRRIGQRGRVRDSQALQPFARFRGDHRAAVVGQ